MNFYSEIEGSSSVGIFLFLFFPCVRGLFSSTTVATGYSEQKNRDWSVKLLSGDAIGWFAIICYSEQLFRVHYSQGRLVYLLPD